MQENKESAWAEYVIEGTAGDGVSARDLAALLENLTVAARHVAADLLGQSVTTGPLKSQDRALSDIRVKEINKGSVRILLAPPRDFGGVQLQLLGGDDRPVTADEVVRTLQQSLSAFNPDDAALSPGRRTAMADVIRASMRLGSDAHMTTSNGRQRTRMNIPLMTQSSSSVEKQSRIAYGLAFMVDIEPGSSRMRIRTYDHQSIRLDVPASLRKRLDEVIGKPVEVRFDEYMRTTSLPRRVVRGLRILSEAEYGRAPVPPRWLRLAAEMEISLDSPPLEPKVDESRFESQEECEEFLDFLASLRADDD